MEGNFFEKSTCIMFMYMVYSNSGQENTPRNTVRQAKQISFEKRNLKNACKVGSDVIRYKSC